jgi:hypothetical protein
VVISSEQKNRPAAEKNVGANVFHENSLHVMYRPYNQGDQIGRIFAYWVTVFFGKFL